MYPKGEPRLIYRGGLGGSLGGVLILVGGLVCGLGVELALPCVGANCLVDVREGRAAGVAGEALVPLVRPFMRSRVR